VSRGSLYHHFPGKDRLFEAVVEAVHTRVGEATLAAATASGAAEAYGLLKTVLQEAADAARVPAQLVEPFAHILLAAGNEMALVIALADDVAAAQTTAEAAVEEFLSRMLQPTESKNTDT
jgi:AcrR family transcriptional regulator